MWFDWRFHRTRSALAATERDSAVRLYDTETGDRAWSHVVKLTNIYENYTSAIAFSPDGKMLAVCATDNRIYLIEPRDGRRDRAARWSSLVSVGAGIHVEQQDALLIGWDGFIRRWDVAARKQLALPAGVRATGVVAASPDGRTLAYEIDSARFA